MPVSRRQFATGLGVAALLPARPIVASAPSTPSGPVIPQPMADRSLDIISPARVEVDARRALAPGAWEYIHGGAGSEWTLGANRTALDDIVFRPHRLAGFAQADTRATLFDIEIKAPIYVCPMGAQDFAHADAELASVGGASRADVPYMLSSASNKSLEEVARAASPDLLRFFAIYLNIDPRVNKALARRARAAGYRALVMTVDSLGAGTSDAYLAMGSPRTAVAGLGNFDPARGGMGNFRDLKRDFTPVDIIALKKASALPVLVKGILRADDALRAVAGGADGIVVSNHGGRTLDGAVPAIDALPAVVRAVGGRVPILFDSGVRRGNDIVRALARGATAVGVGRPVLDAMAVGGATGACSMLRWFQDDLATQMMQIGAQRISDLSPDLLASRFQSSGR